jgi:hypothetical protein
MNKNNKNNNIPEHLFVKNPFNGMLVNILPMFSLMDEQIYEIEGTTKNIVEMIQIVHDFTSSMIMLDTSSTFESQFEKLQLVNHHLIKLRKTFEAMEEFKS